MADDRNFAQGRYATSGDAPVVKLGINETSTESYDNGCIPGNIGARKHIGDRVYRLGTALATTVTGKLYAQDTVAAANLTAEIVGVASS